MICLMVMGNLYILSMGGGETDDTVRAGAIIVDVNGAGNYTTIQEAVDNAKPGDTIYVKPGSYFGKIVIDKSLTLIGSGSANTTIKSNGGGTAIFLTADSVIIRGFNIREAWWDSAVYMTNVSECIVENCTLTNSSYGIYALSSNNNTISNNIISNNSHVGIYLEKANYNYVLNNICNTNNGDNYSVSDENRDCGIYLFNCIGNKISNNTCVSNYNYGISAKYSESNEIRDNICLGNGFGIYEYNGRDNKIANNTCKKSTVDGIILWISENCTVTGNNCDYNYENGISILQSSSAHVSGNHCDRNYLQGIYSWFSDCSIMNNTCESNILSL